MKIIYLLRHGSAEDKKEVSDDKQRKLTKDGRSEIKYVSKIMEKSGLVPDIIISSPAVRAFETAVIFAQKINYPEKKIELLPLLYETTNPDDVIQYIQKIPDTFNSVCLAGHNPLLEKISESLIAGFSHRLPKGSLLSIHSSTSSWTNISNADNQTGFLDYKD